MRICFCVEGCFPVGEFYLRAVLSDNYGDRVASFYQAIFEIFDILLKIGLRRISPQKPKRFSFN